MSRYERRSYEVRWVVAEDDNGKPTEARVTLHTPNGGAVWPVSAAGEDRQARLYEVAAAILRSRDLVFVDAVNPEAGRTYKTVTAALAGWTRVGGDE